MKVEIDDKFIQWLLDLKGPDGLFYSLPALSEDGKKWAVEQKINNILKNYRENHDF